jgi:transcriptional regulator with XRE-family HTH domain
MATLKKIVAEQLEKLGVTQKEIAEKAGLNSAYLSEILSGKKLSVQRRFVPALAYALELEPEVFYEISGDAKSRGAPTSAPSRRTIIQSDSAQAGPMFSQEMKVFQSGPTFNPLIHVPFFKHPFSNDFRSRFKKASWVKRYPFDWDELFNFEALVWPEFLGPSKGCYAITAKALNVEAFLGDSVLLVAPGRSIKSGNYFVGTFSYKRGSSRLELHRMVDATDREFILADFDGRERRVPRDVIKHLHRVVGLFEQPDEPLESRLT